MYRHTTDVTAADLRPFTLDLDPDGGLLPPAERYGWEADPSAPGRSFHLNFDQILRRCGYAWLAFLATAGDGVFGTGVIVPRVEVDFLAEVRLGRMHADVTVAEVGKKSFRLALTVTQDGVIAARVEVVLVVFDYAGGVTLALSTEQRSFLQDQPVRG